MKIWVTPKVLRLEPPKENAKHDVSGMMNLAVCRENTKFENKIIKLTTVHWSNVKLPDVENVLSSHKVLSPEILPERSSPAETGNELLSQASSKGPLPVVGNLKSTMKSWGKIIKKEDAESKDGKEYVKKKSTCTH